MYIASNFDHLLGLPGFSDNALNTHFKLYAGYVANTNRLTEQLANSDSTSPQYAELKRRFGWEFNGMRLHEYYFGALTKDYQKLDQNSELFKKLSNQFGNFENWKKDFMATASARGIGWTILYYDKKADRLFSVWVNEHDAGHLADCKLLLNLDVFEHAFMLDYGTDKTSYLNAFMEAIDWKAIEKRFDS
jgi:Fe-Mn family superoxide dismutase